MMDKVEISYTTQNHKKKGPKNLKNVDQWSII